MIDLIDSICLGTITKTHGIKGRVVLKLDRLSSDDILKMELVFIEIDGLPVPFFIQEFEEKTADTLILAFEDIVTEESAIGLIDSKLYIKKNDVRLNNTPNEINQLFNLKGYTVIDIEIGELGILQDILDIEMNPLLKIVIKKKEILLPVQNEFITTIDSKNKILFVNTPAGLIDLF